MDGTQFLQAAEERCLADLCGSPLCPNSPQNIHRSGGKLSVDLRAQNTCVALQGLAYCGEECEKATHSFAQRLGSSTQAMNRFERLLEQLQQQKQRSKHVLPKSEEFKKVPTGVDAVNKDKSGGILTGGVLKKTSFAAGTQKTPIMSANVKASLSLSLSPSRSNDQNSLYVH